MEDISIIVEQSEDCKLYRFTVVNNVPMSEQEARENLIDLIKGRTEYEQIALSDVTHH